MSYDKSILQHSCYLIPYYIDNRGEVFVSLGKKYLYSDQQGFLMNNPKQWVAPGGFYKKIDKSRDIEDFNFVKGVYANAIKEFNEETGLGHLINKKFDPRYIYTISEKTPFQASYSIFFVRINEADKDKFNTINREKTDIYFYELEFIEWIPLHIALQLTYENNFIYVVKESDVLSYLKDFKDRGEYWRIRENRFYENLKSNYIKVKTMNKVKLPNNFEDVLDELKTRGHESSENILKFFKIFLQEVVTRKSKTEWFFEGLREFGLEIDNIVRDRKVRKVFFKKINKEIIQKYINRREAPKLKTSFDSMVNKMVERCDMFPKKYFDTHPEKFEEFKNKCSFTTSSDGLFYEVTRKNQGYEGFKKNIEGSAKRYIPPHLRGRKQILNPRSISPRDRKEQPNDLSKKRKSGRFGNLL